MFPLGSSELLNRRSLLLRPQHPHQQQHQQQQHITSESGQATSGIPSSNVAARRYPTSGGTFVMSRHDPHGGPTPSSSSSSAKSVGDVTVGGVEQVLGVSAIEAAAPLSSAMRAGDRTSSQFSGEIIPNCRSRGANFAVSTGNHRHQPRQPLQQHYPHPVPPPSSSFCAIVDEKTMNSCSSGSGASASPANGQLVLDLRAIASNRYPTEQPLDLTGGSDGRKRHLDQPGDGDSSIDCRPLDLSVKRQPINHSGSTLSSISQRHAASGAHRMTSIGNSIRGGTGSIQIAPAPVPLVQLQQHSMGLKVENVRYGLDQNLRSHQVPSGSSGDGPVPVIQRLVPSATSNASSPSRFNSSHGATIEHKRPRVLDIDRTGNRATCVGNGSPMPIAATSAAVARRDSLVDRLVSTVIPKSATNHRHQYPQNGLRQLLPKCTTTSANDMLVSLQARYLSGGVVTSHRSHPRTGSRLPSESRPYAIAAPPSLIRQAGPRVTSRIGNDRVRAQSWSLPVGVEAVGGESHVVDFLQSGRTANTAVVLPGDSASTTALASDVDSADGLYFRDRVTTVTTDNKDSPHIVEDQTRPRFDSGGRVLASKHVGGTTTSTLDVGSDVIAGRRSTSGCLSEPDFDESRSSAGVGDDASTSHVDKLSKSVRCVVQSNYNSCVLDDHKHPVANPETARESFSSSLNGAKIVPLTRAERDPSLQRDLVNLPSATNRRLIPVANVQPIMKDSSTLNPKSHSLSSSEILSVRDKPSPIAASMAGGCEEKPRTLIDLTGTTDWMPTSSSSSTGMIRADFPEIPLLVCGGQGACSSSVAVSSAGSVISSGRTMSSHHMEYVKFLQQTITSSAEEAGGLSRGGTGRGRFALRGRGGRHAPQLVTPPSMTSGQQCIQIESIPVMKKPSKALRRGFGSERSSTAVRRQLLNHFGGTGAETASHTMTMSGVEAGRTGTDGRRVDGSGNTVSVLFPPLEQRHVLHVDDSASPSNDVILQSDVSNILVVSNSCSSSGASPSMNKKSPIVYFDDDNLCKTMDDSTGSDVVVRQLYNSPGAECNDGSAKRKIADSDGDTRPKKTKLAQPRDDVEHRVDCAAKLIGKLKTNRRRKLSEDKVKVREDNSRTDGTTNDHLLKVARNHYHDVIDETTNASNTSAASSDAVDPSRGRRTASAASSSAAATTTGAAEAAMAEAGASAGAAKKRRRATNIDLLIGESGVALSDIQRSDGTGNRWKRRSRSVCGSLEHAPAIVDTGPVTRRGRGAGRKPRRHLYTKPGSDNDKPPDDSTVNDNEHDDVIGKCDHNESDDDGRPTAMLEYPGVCERRRMRGGHSTRRRQRSRYAFVSDGRNTPLSSIGCARPEMEMVRFDMDGSIANKSAVIDENKFDTTCPSSTSASGTSVDPLTESKFTPLATTSRRFLRGVGRTRNIGRRRRGFCASRSCEASGQGLDSVVHNEVDHEPSEDDVLVNGVSIVSDIELSATCDSSETIELEYSGETVLHQAARFNYQEVVLCLLKSETISANVQDNSGRTPLHISSSLGHVTIARMLLAYGAHPNCKTIDGTRPIHGAIVNGHLHLVRELLLCGADVTLPDGSGRSGLQLASGRPMRTLIRGVLSDLGVVEDRREIPWEFHSSFENKDNDVLDDAPASDDEANGVMFESSVDALLPVYRFQPEWNKGPRNYHLLDDVMQSGFSPSKRITKRDESLSAATSCLRVTAEMIERQIRTSVWNRSTTAMASKLAPCSADGIRMIATSDVLRQRTGVETTFIDVDSVLRHSCCVTVKVKQEPGSVFTTPAGLVDDVIGSTTSSECDEKDLRLLKMESDDVTVERRDVDRIRDDNSEVVVTGIKIDDVISLEKFSLPVLEKQERPVKPPRADELSVTVGVMGHDVSEDSVPTMHATVKTVRRGHAVAQSRRPEMPSVKEDRKSMRFNEDDDERDMPELTLFA